MKFFYNWPKLQKVFLDDDLRVGLQSWKADVNRNNETAFPFLIRLDSCHGPLFNLM